MQIAINIMYYILIITIIIKNHAKDFSHAAAYCLFSNFFSHSGKDFSHLAMFPGIFAHASNFGEAIEGISEGALVLATECESSAIGFFELRVILNANTKKTYAPIVAIAML